MIRKPPLKPLVAIVEAKIVLTLLDLLAAFDTIGHATLQID